MSVIEIPSIERPSTADRSSRGASHRPDPAPTASLHLADGATLAVRPIDAGATAELTTFLESLSAEARYRRFFQAVPVVKPAFVRTLCDIDQIDHVGWLLSDGASPVAEVRAVRLRSEPTAVEVAVAVHHEWRRRGLADRALRALAVALPDVETFTAWIQPDNQACATLMRRLGLDVAYADGMLEARGAAPAWTGDASDAAGLEAMQVAAATAGGGTLPAGLGRAA